VSIVNRTICDYALLEKFALVGFRAHAQRRLLQLDEHPVLDVVAHVRRICARANLTLLFPNRMARSFIVSLFLFLASTALWTPRAAAQSAEGSVYGPLPVFEFHSGFWVNLHHTLYQ
jgi:hypothetical protein